jgi:hypothetical protein
MKLQLRNWLLTNNCEFLIANCERRFWERSAQSISLLELPISETLEVRSLNSLKF